MVASSVFPLRFLVVIYFSVLAAAAIISVWFASHAGDAAGTVYAVSGGLLLLFSLLLIALFLIIHRRMASPLAALAGYVEHTLDGEYAEAETVSAKASVPVLGDLVRDLSVRFKDRMGFGDSFLKGLPVPICIVDTDSNVTFLNRECLDMIGSDRKPEDFYGRSLSQIFYQDDRRSKITGLHGIQHPGHEFGSGVCPQRRQRHQLACQPVSPDGRGGKGHWRVLPVFEYHGIEAAGGGDRPPE